MLLTKTRVFFELDGSFTLCLPFHLVFSLFLLDLSSFPWICTKTFLNSSAFPPQRKQVALLIQNIYVLYLISRNAEFVIFPFCIAASNFMSHGSSRKWYIPHVSLSDPSRQMLIWERCRQRASCGPSQRHVSWTKKIELWRVTFVFSVSKTVSFLTVTTFREDLSRFVWRREEVVWGMLGFQTKQGVLWPGRWVTWFLDDLSARMFLLLDSCCPIGAGPSNQKQEAGQTLNFFSTPAE